MTIEPPGGETPRRGTLVLRLEHDALRLAVLRVDVVGPVSRAAVGEDPLRRKFDGSPG